MEEIAEVKGPVVGGLTVVNDESTRDDYNMYKRLLQNLEYLRVQEDYIKDELHNLKKEYRHAQEEVSLYLFPQAPVIRVVAKSLVYGFLNIFVLFGGLHVCTFI